MERVEYFLIKYFIFVNIRHNIRKLNGYLYGYNVYFIYLHRHFICTVLFVMVHNIVL